MTIDFGADLPWASPAEDMVALYALCDPRSAEIRYLGRTCRPVRRYREHTRKGQGPAITRTSRWIAQLRALGLRPLMRVLQWVPASEWSAAEAELIAAGRAAGLHLTNIANGGEGGLRGVPKPADFGPRLSLANKSRVWTPEMRAAASLCHRGYKHTDLARQQMSAAHRKRYESAAERMKHARPRTLEEREHLRAIMTGRPLTPAARAALLASRSDPEERARIIRQAAQTRIANGYHHSPDVLARIGAKLRGRKASPELREKLRQAQALRAERERQEGYKRILTDEGRAAIAAANRRRVWSDEARAKSAARIADHNRSAEMRRKTSERMTLVWAERRKQRALLHAEPPGGDDADEHSR